MAALTSPHHLGALSHHLTQTLRELGLCLKEKKSTLAPTTKIKQLGLVVDSKICTFSAPASKLAEIQRDGSMLFGLAFRQARLVKAKLLAQFLGKIAFLGLMIRPAKFFTHNLH